MSRIRKIHRRLTWALQVVIFLGVVASVLQRRWMIAVVIAGILILTLIPTLLSRKFRILIPPEFELVTIGFVFVSLFLGEVQGFYVKFWWWDVVLHTTAGFLVGILGFLLVYVLNHEPNINFYMKPGFVALFSFAFAMMIGVVWEIFEFSMDQVFGFNMQKSGLIDTMWDLIVDAVGAISVSLMGYVYLRTGTESFIMKSIGDFVRENPSMFDGATGTDDRGSPR